MKKMELGVRHSELIGNRKLFSGLEKLSPAESAKIMGGSSLWYWIGYVVGYIGPTDSKSSSEQSAGQTVMTRALG
jgi:hypothetical protein